MHGEAWKTGSGKGERRGRRHFFVVFRLQRSWMHQGSLDVFSTSIIVWMLKKTYLTYFVHQNHIRLVLSPAFPITTGFTVLKKCNKLSYRINIKFILITVVMKTRYVSKLTIYYCYYLRYNHLIYSYMSEKKPKIELHWIEKIFII